MTLPTGAVQVTMEGGGVGARGEAVERRPGACGVRASSLHKLLGKPSRPGHQACRARCWLTGHDHPMSSTWPHLHPWVAVFTLPLPNPKA